MHENDVNISLIFFPNDAVCDDIGWEERLHGGLRLKNSDW